MKLYCNSETYGPKQLRLYKFRSRNIRLTWCKTVLDIIKNFNIKSINDLGCNYFQLFKEIHIRELKYDYLGYDLDKKFIKIGVNYLLKLKTFKKFKNKLLLPKNRKKHAIHLWRGRAKFNYEILNVENEKLRICDCSVLSAILEHVNYPNKVLRNVFKTTKKIIILRTFIDVNKQNAIQIKNVKKPFYIRNFSFNSLKKFSQKTVLF